MYMYIYIYIYIYKTVAYISSTWWCAYAVNCDICTRKSYVTSTYIHAYMHRTTTTHVPSSMYVCVCVTMHVWTHTNSRVRAGCK